MSDTTGVMPWSKSVFHCEAREEGEGDWRSAGRVTSVELRFVPAGWGVGSLDYWGRGRGRSGWNGPAARVIAKTL